MELWEDGIIAALAAIGLVTVLFALLSALLRPKNCDGSDAFAVVPCRGGEGAQLERTVRTLERARYEYGGFRRIVILDCGMDGETRQIAALLCREGRCVSLCEEAEQERIFTKQEPGGTIMKTKLTSLCLALCLTLLAGCAGPAAETEPPAEPAVEVPADTAAEAPADTAAEAPADTAAEQPEMALTYRIEREDRSGDYPIELYFDYPVFDGDSPAARRINDDFAAARENFAETAETALDMVRESMGSEYGPTEESPYLYTCAATVSTCTEELVSVAVNYEWFMGGVMDYGANTYNYNAGTGERIDLTDLLDGTEDEIKESIIAALLEQYPGVEEAGVMETPMDTIRGMELSAIDFCVVDGAVEVIFDKYEIAYGAAGMFNVTLPDALKPLN